MPKPTAKESRKTNARQKPEMKSIKSGQAMEENSIGSNALSSSASNDSQRAVGTNHQKNNSTDERVLASGDTDSQRAVGTNHQKDNSTNSRVLASGPTNADRAVDTTHVKDGAIRTKFNGDGTTDFSHLQRDSVGGRELLSHATQNALRAVSRNHLKDGVVNADKIQDGQVTNEKLAGNIPNGKLAQDMSVFARSENTYNQGATDTRFLKSDKHPAFGKGHGNDHHDPDFQPKGGANSVGFHAKPLQAQQEMLRVRANLRTSRGELNAISSRTADQERQLNIIEGILHTQHLLYDMAQMRAEKAVETSEADERYKDIWTLMQTYPMPQNSYFLIQNGRDIRYQSGNFTSGDTDDVWYPPKQVSTTEAYEIEPNGRQFVVDISEVPEGETVVVFVAKRPEAEEFGPGSEPQPYETISSDGEFVLFANSDMLHETDTCILYYGGILKLGGVPGQSEFTFTVDGTEPFTVVCVVIEGGDRAETITRTDTGDLSRTQGTELSLSPLYQTRQVAKGLTLSAYTAFGGPYEILEAPAQEPVLHIEGDEKPTLAVFNRPMESSDYVERHSLTWSEAPSEYWSGEIIQVFPRNMTPDEALVAAGYEV